MKKYFLLLLLFSILFVSCSNKDNTIEEEYTPIPYSLEVPELFKQKLIAPLIPINNPLTEEGIALGKKLFFDKKLSKDNTQSCASCHNPRNSFTDSLRFSLGVDGVPGSRNSMPLFNLGWNFNDKFAWDGKELSLERQALEPVINPIEMHNSWSNVALRLQQDQEYPSMFLNAFGTERIDSTLVTKAIAQFERTLISGNAKFDQYLLGNTSLNQQELNGFTIFMSEDKGDCFHCHGGDNNPLWTDNDFHNNGLDSSFNDLGLGAVTGDLNDNGKFKSPSLRNLIYTAPYMHDGRFSTLEEVINHYSEGLLNSSTIDPLMKKVNQGGVQLTPLEKADLKAFLITLTDTDFINNPSFQN
ncbi:cytochrome-c peroxidase [Flavobacteriaceae bacterium]|nr:cytochrome-c peroxidase [Flavobacteriaceae bacterium]MDB2633049.1 cytochrome-c peroxidase [Flavobacteriaceae bacterium]MDB2684570.1 cytochrome-c peroxidase [Flavobacteriaceae bacterium]MDC0331190.1 cytochrome-c peroxidase [Flavobacteriaceae bacterium]